MKERLYGWYPAAQDIYISNRQPKSYDKECLYRHHRSEYSCTKPVGQDDLSSPPVTSVKISLSPRPQRRSTSPARTASCTSYRAPSKTQFHTRVESRADSVPSRSGRPLSVGIQPRASVQPSVTPKKAWSMHIPETPVSFVPHPPSEAAHSHECDQLNICTPEFQRVSASASGSKPERVRSATYSRPRSTLPPRPVKSAGPTRSPPATTSYSQSGFERPRAPVPTTPVDEDWERCTSTSTWDYDEQLEKHGWRMEIPGDPLNLKRPCIAKRLPVTYKVKTPTVRPTAPKAQMTNYETFFLNTIPRKPLSFTIHPEWVSEVLHAKRMELQKREGGYKYRCHDYGFVY